MKMSTTRASRSPKPRWPPSKSNPPTSTASGTTPLLQGSRTDSAVIRAQALSSDPGQTVGLNDRGILKPGYKADVNVIDYARLHLHAPRTQRDLPAGGRRLTQKADGYEATIVSGKVTYRNGQAT